MLLEDALPLLRHGKKLAREGWNGNDLHIRMQTPDINSKMNLPYVYIQYPEDHKLYPGARVPWLASQTDLLADDWVMVA